MVEVLNSNLDDSNDIPTYTSHEWHQEEHQANAALTVHFM